MKNFEARIRVRGPKPNPIELSERQISILEKILRRHTSTQQLVRRAKLILTMNAGKNNQQTARIVGVHRETVIAWRRRWLEAVPQLTGAEMSGVSDNELLAIVELVLTDEARVGAPVKFDAKQVTRIIAISCSSLEESEYPFTTWSGSAIREVAISRRIVDQISKRTIQRFLKRSRFKTSQKSVLAQRQL